MKLITIFTAVFAIAVVLLGSVLAPAGAVGKVNSGGSTEIKYDITLADLLGPAAYAWDGSLTYVWFDPAELEAFLAEARPASPARGCMAELDRACEEYDVNPALVMGIMGHETEFATTGTGASINNPFGLKCSEEGQARDELGHRIFSSVAESFAPEAERLRRVYLDLGFDTVAKISYKYSDNTEERRGFPGQCLGVPWGELPDDVKGAVNQGWTSGVETIVKQVYVRCCPRLVADGDETAIREAFVSLALSYVGYPYEIPANTPDQAAANGGEVSFNCSVLVEYCFRAVTGANALPAPSRLQARTLSASEYSGDVEAAIAAMQPGDIVFFEGSRSINGAPNPPPGHVGIYIGEGRFVHAAGHAYGVIVSDLRSHGGFWNWGSLSLVVGGQ